MRRLRRAGSAILATFAITALLSGCAKPPALPPPVTLAPPPGSEVEYAIQPGDVLTIRFYYHPNHNQSAVLVRNDGRITLPLVGDVDAAGLTPSELSRQLETKYSSNLREPAIAVSIKEVYQNLVWVGGEVKKPGFVEYRPGLTAVEALVAAGGPKDSAAINECLWLQKVARQEYRSSRLDLTKPVQAGDGSTDLVLGPMDVLFVPKTTIAKVNVWVDQHIVKMIPIRFTERIDQDTSSSSSSSSEKTQKTESTKPPPAARNPTPEPEPGSSQQR